MDTMVLAFLRVPREESSGLTSFLDVKSLSGCNRGKWSWFFSDFGISLKVSWSWWSPLLWEKASQHAPLWIKMLVCLWRVFAKNLPLKYHSVVKWTDCGVRTDRFLSWCRNAADARLFAASCRQQWVWLETFCRPCLGTTCSYAMPKWSWNQTDLRNLSSLWREPSLHCPVPSLKLTFSPLKMDGWKMIVSFWDGFFLRCELLVFGGVVPFLVKRRCDLLRYAAVFFLWIASIGMVVAASLVPGRSSRVFFLISERSRCWFFFV